MGNLTSDDHAVNVDHASDDEQECRLVKSHDYHDHCDVDAGEVVDAGDDDDDEFLSQGQCHKCHKCHKARVKRGNIPCYDPYTHHDAGDNHLIFVVDYDGDDDDYDDGGSLSGWSKSLQGIN